MEELNRRGKEFVNEWCEETHSTTKRIPNQHYLLEEKATLIPLPEKHFYVKPMHSRKISPDSYISIDGNKYSVPVRYVGKKVLFRMNYGFRIMVYDSAEKFIMSMEAFDGRHQTRTNKEHYKPIAPKVATSIPQIRRDFTARFRNGARYLEAAGRKFDQPTHHARKIMEMQDLYDDAVLDELIGAAVDEGKMDICSFRSMLREYNSGQRKLESSSPGTHRKEKTDTGALTRDCSYYEEYAKEASHAGNNS